MSFELSRGVRMVTVTNTTPVSGGRTVNRVALLRNFARRAPGGKGGALQRTLDGLAQARVCVLRVVFFFMRRFPLVSPLWCSLLPCAALRRGDTSRPSLS